MIPFIRQHPRRIGGHHLYMSLKGKLAGEHLVENDTGAKDIRASVTAHPESLLWRHVVQGADDLTSLGGVQTMLPIIC